MTDAYDGCSGAMRVAGIRMGVRTSEPCIGWTAPILSLAFRSFDEADVSSQDSFETRAR